VKARLDGLRAGLAGWPESAYNGEYIADIAADFRCRQDGARRRSLVHRSGRLTTSTPSASSRSPTCATSRTIDLPRSGVRFVNYYLESSLYADGRVERHRRAPDRLRQDLRVGGGALWLRTTDYATTRTA
jgi:arginyl-tRNA synthetase